MSVKKIKTSKKPAKKIAQKNKPSPKLKKASPEKVEPQKKLIKKTETKPVQKKSPKTQPKKSIKSQPIKSKAKTVKTAPKLEIKAREKSKAGQATSLARSILSRTSEKKIEAIEPTEKKDNFLQRTIFSRKAESQPLAIFKVGDHAIYPSHGIGKIINLEKTSLLGQDLSCYLMYFEKEKLTIKIPLSSAEKIGLRHLISKEQMDEVFSILRSGVKKLKGMWSRRAQEYETKINSGDIMLLAEVLRDLTRDIEDGERSYSERIIYETAINRLANEYSVIYEIEFEEAKNKIILTAKDKLNSESKIAQKDEFDEFVPSREESEFDEDEESEEEDEDEESDDEDEDYDDYDDEDDEKPKKRKGAKNHS